MQYVSSLTMFIMNLPFREGPPGHHTWPDCQRGSCLTGF